VRIFKWPLPATISGSFLRSTILRKNFGHRLRVTKERPKNTPVLFQRPYRALYFGFNKKLTKERKKMKCAAYFLLLCGIVGSQAWGQSVPKHQTSVTMRCAALSCSSSVSSIRRAHPDVILGTFKPLPTGRSAIRTARHEVKLGTFKSYPATSPRFALRQVSQLEKEEKTELLLRKTDAFSTPAVIVLR
jgi:hypothetical protein